MLDLVISDAYVIDGTGAPGSIGSVGVAGDKIGWLGSARQAPPEARRVIQADARTLAPGFIDVHTHSDLGPFVDPWMPSTLRQGVTTVVVGNCGLSAWPATGAHECAQIVGGPDEPPQPASMDAYLRAVTATEPAVNVAALVGHGSVRQDAMGNERRLPSGDELSAMRRSVAQAMEEGAFGLSTGLIYVPGIHASTDELVALATEAAGAGGLYVSHIRGESERLFDAVDEAIEIGRRSRVGVHVSHLKCEGDRTWGRAEELLATLRGAGDVTCDQYPYNAWGSTLASLLPPWASATELEGLLDDEEQRMRLIDGIESGEEGFDSSVHDIGWGRIVIESGGRGAWNGRSLVEVADDMGVTPVEACLAILIDDPDAACIGHAMSDDDVGSIMSDPEVMVASDGASMSPLGPLSKASVHPRNYGTFPRVLAAATGGGPLTPEVAIRKMTSLPAERFGLRGRGTIRAGAFADLVLFDPIRVQDTSTFEYPHAFPQGIDVVVVNGEVAWDGERGARAGRALRRTS